MPIKVQDDLPAKQILEDENIFIMGEARALSQEIRPLEILILNLMPVKEETEISNSLKNWLPRLCRVHSADLVRQLPTPYFQRSATSETSTKTTSTTTSAQLIPARLSSSSASMTSVRDVLFAQGTALLELFPEALRRSTSSIRISASSAASVSTTASSVQ